MTAANLIIIAVVRTYTFGLTIPRPLAGQYCSTVLTGQRPRNSMFEGFTLKLSPNSISAQSQDWHYCKYSVAVPIQFQL